MNIFLTIVHITVSLLLVLVVLLQAGKGAGMGSIMGGSSQSFINSSGIAGILSKITTVAAVIFMLTSLNMGYISNKNAKLLMENTNTTVELKLDSIDNSVEKNEEMKQEFTSKIDDENI